MNFKLKSLPLLTCLSLSLSISYGETAKDRSNTNVIDSLKVNKHVKMVQQSQQLLNFGSPDAPECLAIETTTGKCVIPLNVCKERPSISANKKKNPSFNENVLTIDIVRSVAFDCFVSQKVSQFGFDTTEEIRSEIKIEKAAFIDNKIKNCEKSLKKIYEENYASRFASKKVEKLVVLTSTDSVIIQSIFRDLSDAKRLSNSNAKKERYLKFDTLLLDDLPVSIRSDINPDSISKTQFKIFPTRMGFAVIKSAGIFVRPKMEFVETNTAIRNLTYSSFLNEDDIQDYYQRNIESFSNPDTLFYLVQNVPGSYFDSIELLNSSKWNNVKKCKINQFQLPKEIWRVIQSKLEFSSDSVAVIPNSTYGCWRIQTVGSRKGVGHQKYSDIIKIVRENYAEEALRNKFEKTSDSYIQCVNSNMFWREYCKTYQVRENELNAAIKSGELDTAFLSSEENRPYLEIRYRVLMANKDFERWFCSLLFDPSLNFYPCYN